MDSTALSNASALAAVIEHTWRCRLQQRAAQQRLLSRLQQSIGRWLLHSNNAQLACESTHAPRACYAGARVAAHTRWKWPSHSAKCTALGSTRTASPQSTLHDGGLHVAARAQRLSLLHSRCCSPAAAVARWLTPLIQPSCPLASAADAHQRRLPRLVASRCAPLMEVASLHYACPSRPVCERA